jgi:hypothetical protein
MNHNHARARFIWCHHSGAWFAGFQKNTNEELGYTPPDKHGVSSYVAEINMNLGTAEEIAEALTEHARQAGICLPNAPTF